jgi:hypothetical protein
MLTLPLGSFPTRSTQSSKPSPFGKWKKQRREVANNARSPSLANLHYAPGLVRYNLHRFSAAIVDLNRALALDPEKSQTYYGLALSTLPIGIADRRRNGRKSLMLWTRLRPQGCQTPLLHQTQP